MFNVLSPLVNAVLSFVDKEMAEWCRHFQITEINKLQTLHQHNVTEPTNARKKGFLMHRLCRRLALLHLVAHLGQQEWLLEV